MSIINDIQELLLELNGTRRIILHWIKAHVNVSGNNAADAGAKQAHLLDHIMLHRLSRGEAYKLLRTKMIRHWDDSWKTDVILTDTGRHLRSIRDSIQEFTPLKIRNRREEIVIYRLRIGHVGVAQHMFRFQMSESDTCDECQVIDTIDHFMLQCSKYELQRERLRLELSSYNVSAINLKILLGLDMNYSKIKQTILRNTLKFLRTTNKIKEL